MHALRLILCSLTLAFCGVVYEFALAQSLSILLGNSMVQYAFTLGIFLAAMGAGAFLSARAREPREVLFRLQLALALTGPAAFVGLWAMAPLVSRAILWVLAALLVAAVGAVTGGELPLLMRLAGSARLRVLAADYFGMLGACVAFPLLLLPSFGVFGSFFISSLLNGLVLQGLAPQASRRRAALLWAVPLLLLFVFLKEESVRQWLSQRLIAA